MRLLLALLVPALLVLAPAAQAKDVFEKSKWKVAVTPEDESRPNGARPFDDVISFLGGKMHSVTLQKKGFKPGDYEEDQRFGGVATFKATLTSEKDGKAAWSGRITVTEIEGEMKWTKPDGTELKYTFKGSKQQ